jgi:hypothetical protein
MRLEENEAGLRYVRKAKVILMRKLVGKETPWDT